jgi:hypothetical protein
MNKYSDFGHYPSSCLYLKCRPVYFSKQKVSETGLCLRLQVKPTQLGPIDRLSPYLLQVRPIIAPIFLGRCPSLSAHESESMLRTYLVCRENIRRLAAGKQLARGNSTQYLLITGIQLAEHLTSY